MKKLPGLVLPLLAATLASFTLTWTRSAPLQPPAAPAQPLTSFRVVFGETQQRPADYSGTVTLSAGRVAGITPWRFFRGDAVQGAAGWKLRTKTAVFENQPDAPSPLNGPGAAQNLIPEGVVVTLEAPPEAAVELRTAQGNFSFKLASLTPGAALRFDGGDVLVERTPTPQRVSGPGPEENDYPSVALTRAGTVWVAWQAYRDLGDHVYACYSTGAGWSQPFRLTDQKGDIFGTAVAEDAQGRVWVVWSERTNEDWNLYARSFSGGQWTARRQLTSADSPNLFHTLVRDPSGNLHLVWTGYRDGQSHVFWARLGDSGGVKPVEVSGASAWAPEAAADSKGNLYVVWDSYRTGNYDIFLRRIDAGGTPGEIQQVTHSALFQAHPTIAIDNQDRAWLAWDESGANWGKDWNHEDTYRSTVLYSDRHPRVAVLDNGVWKQPAGDLRGILPARYRRYVELPRLVADPSGRIWVDLQMRTSVANNRADYWSNNGRWEHFLTTIEGGRWMAPMPVPETSSRPEGPFRLVAGPKGVWMAWTNDNKPFAPGGGIQAEPPHNEITAAPLLELPPPETPQLAAFVEPAVKAFPVHPNEAADVERIRAYRTTVGGRQYRILRGDFHRHTEISGDGAGDGSVEDYFRYMLDAAEMDTGTITDHNAGSDNEYTWWRTEKAHDLFHIRGRYTPLFGYERSVNYPNGHRNVVFAQRGVRTLPISRAENQGQVNSGPILFPYLRQHRGIAFEHSLATGQGTDWRDNGGELEPLVEIYQGYHAAYEYEGGPRAESANNTLNVHGGFRPLGFYWNALDKGYKLGIESSSDHISTHCSYTLIYTPSVDRTTIVENMRQRHVYGATDNIILDYRAEEAGGRQHFMGEAFETSAPPKLRVKIVGTDRIASLVVIKNKQFVYQAAPMTNTVDFTYVDAKPEKGESWYYVRAIQLDRNIAWSSPIWVRYR